MSQCDQISPKSLHLLKTPQPPKLHLQMGTKNMTLCETLHIQSTVGGPVYCSLFQGPDRLSLDFVNSKVTILAICQLNKGRFIISKYEDICYTGPSHLSSRAVPWVTHTSRLRCWGCWGSTSCIGCVHNLPPSCTGLLYGLTTHSS